MAIDSIRPSGKELNNALNNQNKLNEKLSSGKRINRASDDPAGLAIADALAAAVDVLGQASRNVADVSSAVEIADGGLEQISNISSRLKELATQSSNGTLSDTQRSALQSEFSALTQEAQRISATTQFNGQNLLSGSDITAQVGADGSSGSQIAVETPNASSLISSVASQNISTQSGAQTALAAIDTFITAVSSSRGELGGSASRLEFANNSIAVEKENAAAAESRIRDADIAETVADRVRNNILVQSNVAVNAQANLSAQSVLKLLG
jgi:flagellin